MTKFWALIVAVRPHVFALGPHEDADKAMKFAEDFCERRTKENEKKNETLPDDEKLPPYDLVYLMDEDDLRALTGEVHRPRVVARARPTVEVATPKKHGEEVAAES